MCARQFSHLMSQITHSHRLYSLKQLHSGYTIQHISIVKIHSALRVPLIESNLIMAELPPEKKAKQEFSLARQKDQASNNEKNCEGKSNKKLNPKDDFSESVRETQNPARSRSTVVPASILAKVTKRAQEEAMQNYEKNKDRGNIDTVSISRDEA